MVAGVSVRAAPANIARWFEGAANLASAGFGFSVAKSLMLSGPSEMTDGSEVVEALSEGG